jgi:hypothetical protein
LSRACFEALKLPREQVREHALAFSWDVSTQQFLQHLHPVRKTEHIPLVQSSMA